MKFKRKQNLIGDEGLFAIKCSDGQAVEIESFLNGNKYFCNRSKRDEISEKDMTYWDEGPS